MLSAIFFYRKGGRVERLGFRGEMFSPLHCCLFFVFFTLLIPHLRFPGLGDTHITSLRQRNANAGTCILVFECTCCTYIAKRNSIELDPMALNKLEG